MSKIKLDDIRLTQHSLDSLPRLKTLREQTVNARAEVCIERARLVTEYLRDKSTDDEPMMTRHAKAIAHFLSNKAALFPDDSLLAGTTTSKPFGAPVYPEFTGLTIWPELDTISDREKNPLQLSVEDARVLNLEVYPYWMKRSMLERTRTENGDPACMRLFERIVFFIAGKAGCISHTVPFYAKVLKRGLVSIIAEAKDKEREILNRAIVTDEDRRTLEFYRGVCLALKGVLSYAANLARAARESAAREGDETKRANFLAMAGVCEHVPAHPARTFREAVNSLWLAQVAVHAENINMAVSPGRLDVMLYPYYRSDMDAGRLSVQEAVELTGCLWLKLNDNTNLVPETAEELFGGAGTVPAVTLGGVDEQGEDAVNDLTYIMLRATELLKTRDPSLNARYHYEKNTGQYRDRVIEVIAATKCVPAFYNDVAVMETLKGQGVNEMHARDYAVIGCVELAVSGRSYDASSSIMLNLVSALELALYNGRRPITGNELISRETGDPSDPSGRFRNFEEFWEAFKAQLWWVIGQAVELNELFGRTYQKALPSPLLSAMFDGPMDSGRDLIMGGALYNASGATHIGFADTVDSLSAIEKAVFLDKKCTFAELIRALKNDFMGHEELRVYLVNRTPKYGSDNPIAVKNSHNLIGFLYESYQRYVNYRGGRYRPAYWSMTNHAGHGKLAGALPNGRRAGRAFASGITPCSQAVEDLSSCLKAVGGLQGRYIPGGEALNLKFPLVDASDPQDVAAFGATVEAYFKTGGLHIQFNVMSYEMLLEARSNPERHPELLVRVSGYSAYFRDLNAAMKEEIITRTAFDLRSGRRVPFATPNGDILKYEAGQRKAGRSGNKVKPDPLLKMIFPFRGKNLLQKLWNLMTLRILSARSAIQRLSDCLGGEFTEELLETLLKGMSVVFLLNPEYRRNIEDFNGRYVFKGEGFTVSAVFAKGRMKVHEGAVEAPDMTVNFKNSHALMNLIFSPKPDVLNAMLTQQVMLYGNLNYLYKFAYMANHLRLKGYELLI